MRVLLYQLDGSFPNVALMRVAAHHRALGDSVALRLRPKLVQPDLFERFDRVYASAIFERSRSLVDQVVRAHPGAVVGGSGIDLAVTLEQHGISIAAQDYALWPDYRQSLGFSQRGCRRRCAFCVVPRAEGAARSVATIAELWRGDPWPRAVVLLDNDFFGVPEWRDRIGELRAGAFRVAFCQGINCRTLTAEQAAAVASVDYRSNDMASRRLYTAWDGLRDERSVMRGLKALIAAGVKPGHLVVYMLIGFEPGETHGDRDHRRRTLRDLGVVPYPMLYRRSSELAGFQRWIACGLDKSIPWREWVGARYQPRNLARGQPELPGVDP